MAIQDLFDFLDASPTAFHAVDSAEKLLKAEGYIRLDESQHWDLQNDTGYYVIRNASSMLVFRTGNAAEPSFRIVTAHTDSPALKLKEGAIRRSHGMLTFPVEVLGGPIMSTWLDRDLGIAGRLIIRDGSQLKTILYTSKDRKVLLPNPPIHLNRSVNKGFEYNPQKHLSAVVQCREDESVNDLYDLASADLGLEKDSILEGDFILYDTQKASLTAWDAKLFSSGRIDNLAMCQASLDAIIATKGQKNTVIAALFDNEETGSISPHGASSSFLKQIMERIVSCRGGGREDFMMSCASSFIISADAAHALHPNFADLYDSDFTPLMNQGPAIKKHASWNYASTGDTAAQFRLICEKANVPCQVYINRSDQPTGKTLGPITAAQLGIPAVDVGSPLWSMHSIRETAGVEDHRYMIESMKLHFME